MLSQNFTPPDQRALLGEFAGNPIYIRRVVDTAEQSLAWEPSFEGPPAVKRYAGAQW